MPLRVRSLALVPPLCPLADALHFSQRSNLPTLPQLSPAPPLSTALPPRTARFAPTRTSFLRLPAYLALVLSVGMHAFAALYLSRWPLHNISLHREARQEAREKASFKLRRSKWGSVHGPPPRLLRRSTQRRARAPCPSR